MIKKIINLSKPVLIKFELICQIFEGFENFQNKLEYILSRDSATKSENITISPGYHEEINELDFSNDGFITMNVFAGIMNDDDIHPSGDLLIVIKNGKFVAIKIEFE